MAVLLTAGCELVIDDDADVASDEFAVVDGTPTPEFESVGGLVLGQGLNSQLICSGTLIGCDTFLTAAHCVCEDSRICDVPRAPSQMRVFFAHAGYFEVDSVAIHPSYAFPADDIAIVRLSQPVEGIEPARVVTTAPPVGSTLRVVGYGRTGKDLPTSGIKRQGQMVRDACDNFDDGLMLCHDAEVEQQAKSCNGDSGGPNFVDIGGRDYVAGVVSGGSAESCESFQNFATSVAAYQTFVGATSGTIGSQSCGPLPPVNSADALVVTAEESLASADRERTYTVEVPPQTAELRVSANGMASDRLRVFLREGEPADTVIHDCFDEGRMTAYCQVDSPRPGTWHVLVVGTRDTQVTMAALPGAPLAQPDNYSIVAGQVAEFDVDDGLLANDRSGHGGALSVTTVTRQPELGRVLQTAGGAFRYEPPTDVDIADIVAMGELSFRYRVEESGYSSEADVSLVIEAPPSGDVIGGCAAVSAGTGAGSLALALFVVLLGTIRRGAGVS